MSGTPDRNGYVMISARIPARLAADLEREARKEDRSLSAEVRRAIRLYLEARR